MSKYGMGLAQAAQLSRRQLIGFAILSAIVNGIVTALIGAWLTQTYAIYQRKTQAVQTIAELIYERRTRAGMVVWAIKRNAESDELRYRKRAYDEAFVAWNTRIQRNIFMIREISGEKGVTRLETQFQDVLVPGLTETDHCLTKAYDLKLNGGDALSVLDQCRMTDLHQFTLDCGATFTNELDRLARFSFLPWSNASEAARKEIEARVDKGCAAMPKPKTAAEMAAAKAEAAAKAAARAAAQAATTTASEGNAAVTGTNLDAPKADASGAPTTPVAPVEAVPQVTGQ